MFQQFQAGLGQGQGASNPLEEGNTEIILECGDLPAERRLRQP